MSSSHTFTDPASGKTRFFHGYLYECRGDTPYGCPYAVRLNNGNYCNHPNCRDYNCGKSRNTLNSDM